MLRARTAWRYCDGEYSGRTEGRGAADLDSTVAPSDEEAREEDDRSEDAEDDEFGEVLHGDDGWLVFKLMRCYLEVVTKQEERAHVFDLRTDVTVQFS